MDFVNKEEQEMRGDRKKEIDGVMVVGAGVVLLIAGAKHMLPTFLEQWRALVFLLLNLVVLSIFFTSIRSNSANTRQTKNTKKDDSDKRIKKSKRSSKWSVTVEELFRSEEVETVVVEQEKDELSKEELNEVETVVVEQEKDELSKEELNAKVEAFIVMFKQQLAMDAQGRRKSIS